jgi:hypothetical protein
LRQGGEEFKEVMHGLLSVVTRHTSHVTRHVWVMSEFKYVLQGLWQQIICQAKVKNVLKGLFSFTSVQILEEPRFTDNFPHFIRIVLSAPQLTQNKSEACTYKKKENLYLNVMTYIVSI